MPGQSFAVPHPISNIRIGRSPNCDRSPSRKAILKSSVGAGIRGGAGGFPELRVRGVGYTCTTTPQAASESNREPVGADILRPTDLRLTVPQMPEARAGAVLPKCRNC